MNEYPEASLVQYRTSFVFNDLDLPSVVEVSNPAYGAMVGFTKGHNSPCFIP